MNTTGPNITPEGYKRLLREQAVRYALYHAHLPERAGERWGGQPLASGRTVAARVEPGRRMTTLYAVEADGSRTVLATARTTDHTGLGHAIATATDWLETHGWLDSAPEGDA